jgi:hypothetical protein
MRRVWSSEQASTPGTAPGERLVFNPRITMTDLNVRLADLFRRLDEVRGSL